MNQRTGSAMARTTRRVYEYNVEKVGVGMANPTLTDGDEFENAERVPLNNQISKHILGYIKADFLLHLHGCEIIEHRQFHGVHQLPHHGGI